MSVFKILSFAKSGEILSERISIESYIKQKSEIVFIAFFEDIKACELKHLSPIHLHINVSRPCSYI